MAAPLALCLSLPLTGRYAAIGRQIETAMRLFVADANAAGTLAIGGQTYQLALQCRDDSSRAVSAAEIYRLFCSDRCAAVLLGPYSSGLVRAVIPVTEATGTLLINHGGAADDLHDRGPRMLVSVLSPASEYLTAFARLLTTLKLFRKRVAIVAAATPFARAVAGGLELECRTRAVRRRGVRIRLRYTGRFDPGETPSFLFPAIRRNRANVLACAGSYDHDLAFIRAIVAAELDLPVLACVAAGVDRFRDDLGDAAEGIVGPSQWEPHAAITPALGPDSAEFVRRMRNTGATAGCDYPAAQAYAAATLAIAAVLAAGSLDHDRVRAALADLRTRTMFGDFAIDPAGRQVGHQMLLVQWHQGRKAIIEPESLADRGDIEVPSGWRLMLASFRFLRLNRGPSADPEQIPPADDSGDAADMLAPRNPRNDSDEDDERD